MIKKTFITLFVLGVLSPFLIVGYYYFNYNYDISSIVNFNPPLTSHIYDKNGKKIANVFGKQNRSYVKFNDIPPRLVEALLAIEDTTFFEHSGVNFGAIFRAFIKDVKARKMLEGASTITQQLVKNELLTREKKISRKIKEFIYSYKVEAALTKEQILERYLNDIYYGHGYYGIKTAANGYFHKKLSDLTLKEMAILVGLPRAPSIYAPTKNYEISMGRANRVLTRMHILGWISDTAFEKGLIENPKVYNDTLTQNRAPFIVDAVERRMKKIGINDFKTGGYEVHTTIDLRLQNAAKKSLKYAYDLALKRIAKYKIQDEKESRPQDVNVSQLNGAMVSLDSKSGNILALVGSVDYKKSSYNCATQGRRQPGSAFKPFLYQIALDLGYSGATKLVDIAKTYEYEKNGKEVKWQPEDYERDYKGLISLRNALVHSKNLATINLVNSIGLNEMLKDLQRFHIKNLPHNLSIALGTISLSPLQLAGYYTSFSNKGVQVTPHLISSIEKRDKSIYEEHETQMRTSPVTQSYIMTTILEDVVKRGTGRRARVRGIELAGKTGTTNNNMDAWFAGYSPTVETVVWFGNDDNTPMYHRETGGRVAAPAFRRYYQQLLKLYPQIKRKFDMPAGIMTVKINGKKEYFSNISKPPRVDEDKDSEGELMF